MLAVLLLLAAIVAAAGILVWRQGWLQDYAWGGLALPPPPSREAAEPAPAPAAPDEGRDLAPAGGTEAQARQRLDAVEQELERLRGEQRALGQRLRDTSASLRVVRDEALALSERAELIEDSVSGLAGARQDGGRGADLRLDEVELLLSLGRQRLELAADADAALRAYAAARDTLAGIEDAGYTNLRQSLNQELAALRALPEDPRDVAVGELAALEGRLSALPHADRIVADDTPQAGDGDAFDRVLSRMVRVRRSGDETAVAPADRAALEHALQVEFTLARAALERRDQAGFAAALARIDARLDTLYAPSPTLREGRERLRTLAERPLTLDVPLLGTTLAQLRSQRAAPRPPAEAAAPAPASEAGVDTEPSAGEQDDEAPVLDDELP